MSVPNFHQQVTELANKYPREFREAHTGRAETELWIKIVAYELHRLEPRFGLNGKRGTDTLSQDAINYKGIGIGFDPTNNQPVTVIDIIGGAGGPDPRPTWQVLNDPNEATHRGPGKWIQPKPVPGYHTEGPGVPVPPPPPVDTTIVSALQALTAQVKLLTEVNEAQRKQLDTQTKQLTLQTGQLAELLSRTAQNGDDFINKMTEQVDQQEASNASLKASVDGLNDRMDRGFKVNLKGKWPVGNVSGDINLK